MPTRRGADIAQGWYGLNAVAALLALAHPVVAPGLSVAGATDAPTGVAASPTWYAYDDGLAPSPAPTCPRIADPLEQCSLAEALALAHGGGTVELAGPGPGPRYVGNWDVSPAPGAPLTIKPAPGVQHPVLDGNGGRATGCPTVSCSGPVLKIGSRARVRVEGLTVTNGEAGNQQGDNAGAIENAAGGVVVIAGCRFEDDRAFDGGAIANAIGDGHKDSGALEVSGSVFVDNQASGDGGHRQR